MNLSKVMSAWRNTNKLSIREASSILGIDKSTLFRLEKGKPINQASFAVLLRWLVQQ